MEIYVYLHLRLGYGIQGFDRPSSDSDLCLANSNNDNFEKEVETVFQLHIEDTSNNFDIHAKPWKEYNDNAFNTAGFVCEKEGILMISSCFYDTIPLKYNQETYTCC